MTEDSNPRARAEESRSTLTPTQKERVAAFERDYAVAIAEIYGTRLPGIVVDDLVATSILMPEAVEHIYATPGRIEGRDAFRQLARRTVEQHALAGRAIEFSDAKLRAEIQGEVLDSMRPAERMSRVRDGSLESYLAERVTAELERRHTARGL